MTKNGRNYIKPDVMLTNSVPLCFQFEFSLSQMNLSDFRDQ